MSMPMKDQSSQSGGGPVTTENAAEPISPHFDAAACCLLPVQSAVALLYSVLPCW